MRCIGTSCKLPRARCISNLPRVLCEKRLKATRPIFPVPPLGKGANSTVCNLRALRMPLEPGDGGKSHVDGGCDIMKVTLHTSAGRQRMARSTAPPRPQRRLSRLSRRHHTLGGGNSNELHICHRSSCGHGEGKVASQNPKVAFRFVWWTRRRDRADTAQLTWLLYTASSW
jgi:hypothetical protein